MKTKFYLTLLVSLLFTALMLLTFKYESAYGCAMAFSAVSSLAVSFVVVNFIWDEISKFIAARRNKRGKDQN